MSQRREKGSAQVDYKSLVDRSLQGIILLDREGVAFANPAMEKICGYTEQELESMNMAEVLSLIHPEDRALVAERIGKRLMGEQEPDRYEIRVLDKSGEVRWLELQSLSVTRNEERFIQAHLLDMTERVSAERALKQSESRLRTAIESLPFDFFALDGEGRYVLQNSTCREHWGDLIGKSLSNLEIGSETKALWMENNRRAMSGELVADEVHFDLGAEQRTYYNVIAPVRDDDEIIGIQGVNIDITELKRAQEQKADMERQLLHSQKLEAVGTLAGGVAHDFNNLLMCIIGNLEILKRRLGEGSESTQLASIEVIESAAVQAAGLTKQLLKFSRRNEVERVPVDLKRLIDETVSLIEPTFDEQIAITVGSGAVEPVVWGDPGQLQQVLVNLAVNASDAMPEGGTLSFETRWADDKKHIQIVVSDTGTGISPSVRGRIFEPFFTTKAQDRGTGMGLAVVYSIVESHGGSIAVASEVGEGSHFVISLPVEHGRAQDNLEKTTRAEIGPATGIGEVIHDPKSKNANV